MIRYIVNLILNLFRRIKEFFMPLIRNRNTLRISATDWVNGYLIRKIKPGENVSVDIEVNAEWGEQIIISANKTQGRRVMMVNGDAIIEPDVYLVVVDASQNHVTLTLPVAHDYLGQLSIVCADPSYGIEFITNGSTQNVIFDTSNMSFNAKGDAITLVSDRGQSDPVPPEEDDVESLSDDEEDEKVEAPVLLKPGTWYVVSRYSAQWYA